MGLPHLTSPSGKKVGKGDYTPEKYNQGDHRVFWAPVTDDTVYTMAEILHPENAGQIRRSIMEANREKRFRQPMVDDDEDCPEGRVVSVTLQKTLYIRASSYGLRL